MFGLSDYRDCVGFGLTPVWRRIAPAFVLLLAWLATTPAHAQPFTGQLKSTVVTVGSLVNSSDLDFGTLIAGTSAGTVTIAPTGTRTATGGVTLAGGTPSTAVFEGRGAFNGRLRITVTPFTLLLTRVGGTQTMSVLNFQIGTRPAGSLQRTGPPANPRYRIVNGSGIFDFPIGATLNVAANQMGGTYQGSFNVNVIYE